MAIGDIYVVAAIRNVEDNLPDVIEDAVIASGNEFKLESKGAIRVDLRCNSELTPNFF